MATGATLLRAETRRLYSWWWDSHISPKNSKWLHDNLTDMDIKVKSMIKIIEEDADSFQKRAEMYYRKRPELMKLVEEFYRAYRALAERYDHATGALRQAHETMHEAFPDQIPAILSDESPSNSDSTNLDISQRYALGLSKFSEGNETEDLKATILKLESEKGAIFEKISCNQEEFEKVKERCHQLDNEKQRLQLELGMLKETTTKQKEELGMKQEEIKKLNISIIEESEKSKMDRLSLEKLHSKFQKEMEILVEKLMSTETSKVSIEKENRRLKDDLFGLKDQHISSSLMIKSLQDEIRLLEESRRKLEDEKISLQQEVLSINVYKNDLEQKHKELMEQIGAVNLNVESLQEMIKDLRDGNLELKCLCSKHEDGRILHLKNMMFVEKITKENDVLRKSLSNANFELEELRQKVKTSEESCRTLDGKILMHVSEKNVLVSQIEDISREMKNLSEKNTLLENSLSNMNVELGDLRGKMNVLEESLQSLRNQNSSVLAENTTLVSQVESINRRVKSSERRYAELEVKNINLEIEKDEILHQVSELQNSLRIEKEEYEAHMKSSNSQLDTFENNIHALREKVWLSEEELKYDQDKIIDAQIEIFILRQCLRDIKESNMIISDRCHKCSETSRCQEKLISKLKQEKFVQKKRLALLSQYNEKIATSVLDAQDEYQKLILEKSIILACLEQESKRSFEELLVLQSEKHLCNQREESLKVEMEMLGRNFLDSQRDIAKLIEENQSYSRKIVDLTEKHYALKANNSATEEPNLQAEIQKNLLAQKDMELLNQKFEAVQDKNTELGQSNHTLKLQLGKLLEAAKELKKREKHLTSELNSCKIETETLLNEIHVARIKATIFEEKMRELIVTSKRLKISDMTQKDAFDEEITRRDVYEHHMKEKIDALDGENRSLKKELKSYLHLVLSLGDFVSSLEQHILSLANHHSLNNQEKQDGSQPRHHRKSGKEQNEDHHATFSFGKFELKRLHAKVNKLEKVVIDIQNNLEHGYTGSKTTSQATTRESLGSKPVRTTYQEEAPTCKDVILHLKKKGNTEIIEEKCEQLTKDIQLDHVSSPSQYANGSSSHAPCETFSNETDDQMVELWETKVEAVEEENDENFTDSHQESKRSTSEKLSSNAQRLSVLQKYSKGLKRNMAISDLSNSPTSFEFKKLSSQLEETEAVILQLNKTNRKLRRKAENLNSSVIPQIDEIGNTIERRISQRARIGSEKIGRLEVELQKLEYIWLKLKEENDYKRARDAERRTRVLLRDYFYGRRESPRRKKVHCCACVRPRTRGESP